MRSLRLLTCCILLFTFLFIPTMPTGAAWEGTQRFSLVIQGSITAIDPIHSLSQSFPVEVRATLVVTLNPPSADGTQDGRLRVVDGQMREEEGTVTIATSPSGYRIRLEPGASPKLVDPAPDLESYGIEVGELLTILFPVPSDQQLAEGESWSLDYTQAITVDDRLLTLPISNSFRVNEFRTDIAVVHSTLRGATATSLNPGRITVEHLGSSVLHLDSDTGILHRSAVTVLSNIEKTIPAGARVPEERSEIRTLITTSIERLPDRPETAEPSLGAEYVDPAQRFSLVLPDGWDTNPVLIDRSITLFESPDRQAQIYVDIAPASHEKDSHTLANETLDRYARYLVDFSVLTQPKPSRLGERPATLTEYRYRDRDDLTEGSLYSHIDGYDVALQYATDTAHYPLEGPQLLQTLATHFRFGPHLAGHVTANDLLMAPSVLYESDEYAFEIEVPNLWPPLPSSDGSIAFVELGGAGRLSIHLEPVAPDDSALTLLQQWVLRMQAEQPDLVVVTPAEPAALGPLSGASTTFRLETDEVSVTQKIVVANWSGALYVVSIDYESAGFAERHAVFERILSGFRPLPEHARRQALTFDAYSPPPSPGEASFLLIGRLLHETSDQGGERTMAASDARIDMLVDGDRYVARTDDDGFFYLANLPVEVGDEIVVDSIRGSLFDLPYDVNIPMDGLAVTVIGPIGLFGELTLVLAPDKTGVSLRMESGVDEMTGTSRVHQFFLNRYPDSPWAELVREDLAIRQTLKTP